MTTIILLASREFLLDKIFARLDELLCRKEDTSLLCLVDGDMNLFLKARNLTAKSKFVDRLCVKAKDYGKRSPSQVYRRKRIATLHNEAKYYLKPCDYVLSIEDDGLFPSSGLMKLQHWFKKYPNAGMIEGLAIGRWQSQYIGAWVIDDPHDFNEISSIEYQPDTLIPIDAGGLYFCLIKYENYMQHEFKPFPGNYFGPDIDFCIEMRKKGLENYIDTSILVDHINERSGRVFNITNDRPKIVSLKKTRGTWRFQHKVQSSHNVIQSK